MARKFQNILETVGNTPVVKINKLAPADMNLYVKIEAFNSLDSGKDRLALGVIEAAERSGETGPPTLALRFRISLSLGAAPRAR
jgi:cysteine synthase